MVLKGILIAVGIILIFVIMITLIRLGGFKL